ARVVHEDVEAAELRRRLVHDAAAILHSREVAGEERRASTVARDLHAHLACALGAVRVVDRDRRTPRGELAGDALTDADAGAGDERASSRQRWGALAAGGLRPPIPPGHTRPLSRPRPCPRAPERVGGVGLGGGAPRASSSVSVSRAGAG